MNTKNDKIDFSETLFLPKTSFAMRAGLPEQEPKILDGWSKDSIYEKLREKSKSRKNSYYMMAPHTLTVIYTWGTP